MAVTYGYVAQGDEDPFLARARELINIAIRILTPEASAMFTALPVREFYNPTGDVHLDVENVCRSRKVANVDWCPDGTQ